MKVYPCYYVGPNNASHINEQNCYFWIRVGQIGTLKSPLESIQVTSEAELREALQYIADGGTITLASDIAIKDTLTVDSGNVTITGHKILRDTSFTGTILQVEGASVTLQVDLDGGSTSGENDAAVTVSGGTLTLGTGSSIQDFNTTKESTSTVTVSGGSLIIEGGSITGNTATDAGGIKQTGGTVTLNSGNIKDNTSTSTTGGIHFSGGMLVLNGGDVTGNTGAAGAGGIYAEYGQSTTRTVVIGGGNVPLVIKDNTDTYGTSNLEICNGGVVQRNSSKTLYADSQIGLSTTEWPSSGMTQVVSGLKDGETNYFVSDKPTLAGVDLDTNNRVCLSFDARTATAVYVSQSGSDETGDGTREYPFETIAHAYKVIQNGTINLLTDITMTEMLQMGSNKEVIITSAEGDSGSGKSESIYAINSEFEPKADESLFYISSGKVTFGDLTLNGKNNTMFPNAIWVRSGSTVTLSNGLTIQNFNAAQGITKNGQAVVNVQSATVNMNGARITGCTLEGGKTDDPTAVVICGSGGTFNFNSGEVTGNTLSGENTTSIVNVGSYNWPKFYMTGGSISGNTIGPGYAAVYVRGTVNNSIVQFGGTAYVYDNTYDGKSTGEQKNIYLKNSTGKETDIYVKLQSALTGNAKLGIYAVAIGEGTLVAKGTGGSGYTAQESDAERIISDKPSGCNIIFDKDDDCAIKLSTDERTGQNIYVDSKADSEKAEGTREKPYATIADAYAAAKANDKIVLLSDIILTKTLDLDGNDNLGDKSTVTMTSEGEPAKTITRSGTDAVMAVSEGKIVLKDIILDGTGTGTDNASAVTVSGGSLTLGTGSLIRNFNTTKESTSTVTVSDSGSLIIDGGSITGNMATDAGGIKQTGGTVTLNSGNITDNTSASTAGGIYFEGGQLILNGGSVTGNSSQGSGATGCAGGIYVEGSSGTVTIGGGNEKLEINGNTDENGASNLKVVNGQVVQKDSESTLNNESKIGLSATVWPSGETTQVVSGVKDEESGCFVSDKPKLAGVALETDGKVCLSFDARTATDVYVSEEKGDDTTGDGTEQHPFKTIGRAYNVVQNKGTIHLLSDITQNTSVSVDEDKAVTISSEGETPHSIKRTSESGTTMFNVSQGTLTFMNVTLDGGNQQTAAQGNAIAITGGTVNLGSSATVKDFCVGSSTGGSSGGAVVVSGGTLNMQSGAVIKDNSGVDAGGVLVNGTGAVFKMTGGEISGNSSSGNGAGVNLSLGMFNMSGGEISANSASGNGAGVNVGGGSFNMTGGEISGNCTTSTDGVGGGVYIDGDSAQMSITGGEITENGCTGTAGAAGVHVADGTLTAGGTTVIKNNYCGATWVSGTMTQGTSLSNLIGNLAIDSDHLQAGASIGINTASKLTEAGVKFATGANSTDQRYFHSDRPTDAGVVYCDGDSDAGGSCSLNHDHASGTLWLSTTAKIAGYLAKIEGSTTEYKILIGEGGAFTVADGNDTIVLFDPPSEDTTCILKSGVTLKDSYGNTYVADRDATVIVGTDGSVSLKEGKLTVTADSESDLGMKVGPISGDTVSIVIPKGEEVVVDTSGAGSVSGTGTGKTVTIGGIEYTSGTESWSFPLTGTGYEIDNGDRVSVPAGKATSIVLSNGDDQTTVTVPDDSKSEITFSKADGVTTITVTEKGGSFKIGDETYTAPVDNAVYTIGSDGKVTLEITGDSWTGTDFSYTLKAGESVKVGGYKYTVTTAGDVVLKGRGSGQNPEVTLTRSGAEVKVSSSTGSDDAKQYVAGSDNTKFAMTVVVDGTTLADTKEITLLSNGKNPESRIAVPSGTVVTGGSNTITASGDKTVIEMAGSGGGCMKLVSGDGSTSGSMSATVGGIDHAFSSEGSAYTVNTTDGTLTLGSETSETSVSVKMDEVTFMGVGVNVFNLGSTGGDDPNTTATIPQGASVIGVNATVCGVSSGTDAMKVEIEEDGDLVLVDGRGTVSGEATVYAKVTDVSGLQTIVITDGTTCTIDLDDVPQKATGIGSGESVTIGGVTYSGAGTGDGASSFPLNNGAGRLTNDGESAKVPGDVSTDVVLTLGSGFEPVVTIPASNSGETVLKKGSPSTVTLAGGGKFKVGDKEYTAPEGGATYRIGDDGSVSRVVTLNEDDVCELEPGESVTIDGYTYTAPSTLQKGDVVLKGRETGKNPAVVLKDSGDSVTVALTADPSVKTIYTADADSTTFAMSSADKDTTKIDLLENNSQLKVIQGVTVSVGTSTVKAESTDAIIKMSGGKAVLVSGKVSSSGSMAATIGGSVLDLSGGSEYEVEASDGKLTLRADGTVEVNDKVELSGVTGKEFILAGTTGVWTATIPDGASIKGDEVTIAGSAADGTPGSKATEVGFDSEGKLTLIEGKGTVTGQTTVQVKVAEETAGGGMRTVQVTVPDNCTYVIDADDGWVTGIGANKKVTIGGITYTSVAENGRYPLDPEKGRLTTVGDVVQVSGGNGAEITLGSGASPVISIFADNKETTTVTRGSPSSLVELHDANDAFTVDGTTYRATTAGASFNVDNGGSVSLSSGTVELSDGESIIGASGKKIENPSGSSEDKITVVAGTEMDSVTILSTGGKVIIGGIEYEATAGNTQIEVGKNISVPVLKAGEVKLDSGGAIALGTSVKNLGGAGKEVTVGVNADGSYGAVIPEGGKAEIGGKTIEVPADEDITVSIAADGGYEMPFSNGKTITIDGVSYRAKADGCYISVNKDGNITLNPQGSIETIVPEPDGYQTYVLGPGESATVNGYIYTASSGSVTVQGQGAGKNPTVVLGGSASVTVSLANDPSKSTPYSAGSAGASFVMSSSDTDTSNIDLASGEVSVPSGASVSYGGCTLTAVDDATVGAGSAGLELVSGKGSVTGSASMGAMAGGSSVPVSIPSGVTYVVDTVSETVSGLGQGDSVTIGGITYTSGSENGSFPLRNGTLTNAGDTASVPAGTGADISVGEGRTVEVPGTNKSGTTVTKGTPSTVSLGASDSFVYNNKTYTAGSAGAVFSLGDDGVRLDSGSAVVAAGDSVDVSVGGKDVTVLNTGSSDIVVTAGSGRAQATVASAGDSFTAGGRTYTAGSAGTVFDIGADGGASLSGGSALLGDGESVTGVSGTTITNPAGSSGDRITVAADPVAGKDTVTIPSIGGEVSIGGSVYEAASDDTTIVVGGGTPVLAGGSVVLDGGSIGVGDAGVPVSGPEGSGILVSAGSGGTGSVSIPEGGSAVIAGKTIGSKTGDTVAEIGKDGGYTMSLSDGRSVTIDGLVYTGNGTIYVDKDGNVTFDGSIVTGLPDFDGDYTYVLGPGKSVTIKGYVYTAPSDGEVVLEGRGAGLNPAVILGGGASVTVSLASAPSVSTSYSADSTGASFAMSSSDTDTTEIDLLGSGELSVPSGSSVSYGGCTLTVIGGAVVGAGSDGLELVSGAGSVTGRASLGVMAGGSSVPVGIPSGATYLVDTVSETVSGLDRGDSVSIGGVTYTSGSDGRSFPLRNGSGSLTHVGDAASVPAGTDAVVSVGGSAVTVPAAGDSNSGTVVVTKTSAMATVALSDSGDSFSWGGSVYGAASDGTVIALSDDGTDGLVSGSVVIGGGKGILVGNNLVENTGSSDITVAAGSGGAGSVSIPAGGKVSVGGSEISAGYDVAIGIGSDGKLSLDAGRIDVTGQKTVSVRTDGGYADVTVPSGETYLIDASAGTVSGLDAGESVLIGDVTYTSGADGGSFPIAGGSGTLTNIGDRATVPSGTGTTVSIDGGSDVTVPGTNVETTVIEKTSAGADAKLPGGDSIGCGDMTYTAGDGGATFSVGEDGKASITSGSAALGDGQSVTVNGKTVENPAGTDDDTVSVTVDSVTIPSEGGKAVIDGKEYEAASSPTVIGISGDGVSLISGSVTIGGGDSIAVGDGSVENTGSTGITVTAGSEGSGQVTVPAGGSAGVNGSDVGSASGDVTFVIGTDGGVRVNLVEGQTAVIGDKTYKGTSSRDTELDIGTDGTVTGQEVQVTIDPVSGSGTGSTETRTVGEVISLPDSGSGDEQTTRPGAVMVGWESIGSDGTKSDYGLGSEYVVGTDAEIKGVWVDSSKVMVYATETGGTVKGKTYDDLTSSVIELKSDGVEKDGCVFAGWTPRDGANKDVAYAPGIKLSSSPTTTYMDAYFIKTEDASRLTYDAGDGSSTVGHQWVITGDTVWLPTALDMTRDGYRFVGWARDADSGGPATTGADGGRVMITTSTYKVDEDETIYAVWESKHTIIPGGWDDDDDYPVIIPPVEETAKKTDFVPYLILIAAIIVLVEIVVLVEHKRR